MSLIKLLHDAHISIASCGFCQKEPYYGNLDCLSLGVMCGKCGVKIQLQRSNKLISPSRYTAEDFVVLKTAIKRWNYIQIAILNTRNKVK